MHSANCGFLQQGAELVSSPLITQKPIVQAVPVWAAASELGSGQKRATWAACSMPTTSWELSSTGVLSIFPAASTRPVRRQRSRRRLAQPTSWACTEATRTPSPSSDQSIRHRFGQEKVILLPVKYHHLCLLYNAQASRGGRKGWSSSHLALETGYEAEVQMFSFLSLSIKSRSSLQHSVWPS